MTSDTTELCGACDAGLPMDCTCPAPPKRIQMSRQRPWRADNPRAVIVSRPSHWGNPYPVAHFGREGAITRYRADLANSTLGVAVYSRIREELAGRDLACWCPLDQPCHADVLLEIANAPEGV